MPSKLLHCVRDPDYRRKSWPGGLEHLSSRSVVLNHPLMRGIRLVCYAGLPRFWEQAFMLKSSRETIGQPLSSPNRNQFTESKRNDMNAARVEPKSGICNLNSEMNITPCSSHLTTKVWCYTLCPMLSALCFFSLPQGGT